MPLVQLVITVTSLVAAAGGTWSLERAMERHARMPERSITAVESSAEEDEENERRLHY